MDSSAHKLHTIGVADNAGDVPDSVRANVANAEASAVIHRLLGLNGVRLGFARDDVLHHINERIFSIVDERRASISSTGLHTLLDANLTNALEQIRPGLEYGRATRSEQIQAVARA